MILSPLSGQWRQHICSTFKGWVRVSDIQGIRLLAERFVFWRLLRHLLSMVFQLHYRCHQSTVRLKRQIKTVIVCQDLQHGLSTDFVSNKIGILIL